MENLKKITISIPKDIYAYEYVKIDEAYLKLDPERTFRVGPHETYTLEENELRYLTIFGWDYIVNMNTLEVKYTSEFNKKYGRKVIPISEEEYNENKDMLYWGISEPDKMKNAIAEYDRLNKEK